MKKRYWIIAGILVLGLAAAGCGKKKEQEEGQLPVTVAPAQEDKKSENLVEMEKSTDEDIKNVMGEKTATSSQVILINKTGDDIAAIYIRPNTDDDEEWGEDLVNGMFTLSNGDKAVYYYEKGSKSLYDIRITYTDEDRNECFFRKLPLTTISQISLCMDGIGEDAIPYARYVSGTSKKETSTLKEVKQRLGLLDDDDEEDEEEDSSQSSGQTTKPSPTQAPSVTQAPAATVTPGAEDPEDPEYPGEENPLANTATGYIGQSLENLVGAVGEPSGSDYQEEPESGETGYHYYETENGSFTVSTTVDENGNEVVTGVW